MITRSVSGMLALLPGAAPMAPTAPQQGERRAASPIGGASGTNVMRDASTAPTTATTGYGGPLMTFTHRSARAVPARHEPVHARPTGARAASALTMVTKSGTNAVPRLGVPLCARQVADREGLLHEARRPG